MTDFPNGIARGSAVGFVSKVVGLIQYVHTWGLFSIGSLSMYGVVMPPNGASKRHPTHTPHHPRFLPSNRSNALPALSTPSLNPAFPARPLASSYRLLASAPSPL